MDQDHALKAVVAASAAYSAQTLLAPHTYLQQDDIEVTPKTEGLTRSMGCGILAVCTSTYLASQSSSAEFKTGALTSAAVCLTGCVAVNAHKIATRPTNQSYLDTAVVGTLAAICIAALASK
eukprot:TRINITY_DN475_c0_g1_i1.p1 TRINITY_DN475_c0_g1~~TRINITY_DN475_c0_g1_i1.p1  ORF type:complete len:122 (-),score=18.31 TRINITY_DN475_c0_g1_i1:171-536(-)